MSSILKYFIKNYINFNFWPSNLIKYSNIRIKNLNLGFQISGVLGYYCFFEVKRSVIEFRYVTNNISLLKMSCWTDNIVIVNGSIVWMLQVKM